MGEMGKISEAILSKIKAEAEQIENKAEEAALEEIGKAERQMEIRFEEEKRKVIEDAEREAGRILAEASVKARQELSKTKAEIIDQIISRVKAKLENSESDETSLLNLTREAIESLGTNKVKLYVSPKDKSTMQGLLKRDKELASQVTDIEEFDCSGGVIVESIDGKIRIDNTYDTRLEMLLPQILPEADKILFEAG